MLNTFDAHTRTRQARLHIVQRISTTILEQTRGHYHIHRYGTTKVIRKQSSDPRSACVGHCLYFKTHLTSSSLETCVHHAMVAVTGRMNSLSTRRLHLSVQIMHQSQRVTILCSSMQSSAPACSLGSPMQRLQAKHACGPIPMQSNSHAAQSSRV